MKKADRPPAETHSLTPDRWDDFATLMKSRFDTRQCWCMALRLETNYRLRSAAANRRSIKSVVDTGRTPPGVLAYVNGDVAGWCAVAPRDEYRRLNARSSDRSERERVWSVVCFYVLRGNRGSGLSRSLLDAALRLAKKHGATVVEAYPVAVGRNQFRGVLSVFLDAGFEQIAGRLTNRPLVRYVVAQKTSPRPTSAGAPPPTMG